MVQLNKFVILGLTSFSLLSLSSCGSKINEALTKYGNVFLAHNGLFDGGEVTLSSYGKIKVDTEIKISAIPLTNYEVSSITLNNNKITGDTFKVIEGDNRIDVIFTFKDDSTPKEPIEMDLPDGKILPGYNKIPNTQYELITSQEYYKDIDFNASKEVLKSSLNTLISTNIKTYNYGDSRYTMLYTEEAISSPGKILSLYDSKIYDAVWDSGKTYNREHVWCRNHLQIDGEKISTNNTYKGIGSDLHNLKPLTSSLNSSRGDKYFNEKTTSVYFFPNHEGDLDYRGDVARICFYMALRYDKLVLTDSPFDNYTVSFGMLSSLLKWNELDPVDEFELRRTNRIYEFQGNRNPFVDYPYTLANKLFS